MVKKAKKKVAKKKAAKKGKDRTKSTGARKRK